MQEMKDTSPEIEILLEEKYRRMSGFEKIKIASDMFESALKIVRASLPKGLSESEKKIACFKRIYSGDFNPEEWDRIIEHLSENP